MKKLSYLLLLFLSVIVGGCSEFEQPYVGYIVIERALLDATASSSTTITADTDISSAIVIDDVDADWCEVSVKGKEITITATSANTGSSYRTATVSVTCGYREATFTVLQKYDGQEFLQYDWTRWSATGNGVQSNDGGGYPSLFTEDRTTFWHSPYSTPVDLPYILEIDMKEELECAMFHIGRRYYSNGNNYGTVKTMNIYASTDNENFEKVGGFTFALPWTAPDGTVVTGATSPLIPAYEEVILPSPVTARYIRLEITETNMSNNACQVSYFKAFERI